MVAPDTASLRCNSFAQRLWWYDENHFCDRGAPSIECCWQNPGEHQVRFRSSPAPRTSAACLLARAGRRLGRWLQLRCLLLLVSPEQSRSRKPLPHFDSAFKMRHSKHMFLLQTAKNVSSWHPSVISGDDGWVPGVVLLSPYYYSCRVFGIWLEKQTPIAPCSRRVNGYV